MFKLETKVYNNYLGIIEDRTSNPSKVSFYKVKEAQLKRLERVCTSNLDAIILFRVTNEYEIFLTNYHIGLQHIDSADFENLNHEIKKILVKHKFYRQPGCRKRAWLPRNGFGSGLYNLHLKVNACSCSLIYAQQIRICACRLASKGQIENINIMH